MPAARIAPIILQNKADGLLAHLQRQGQIAHGPRSIHILDFDERIVASVRRFARDFGLDDRVFATVYNVADPLPQPLLGRFNAFHTNPPFGASNGGRSVKAFIRRSIEASSGCVRGCVVLADDDSFPWTQQVLYSVQEYVLSEGFLVSELRPKAHAYHLDDAPSLTSCSLLIHRLENREPARSSASLEEEDLSNFYGKGSPLSIARVKDRTAGGRFPSRDHELIPYVPTNLFTLKEDQDEK